MSIDDVPDQVRLPGFVLGVEGAPPASAVDRQIPRWLHRIRHQYGGLSCLQVELFGCLLRLGPNQREGTGKLWLLTRALVELGEMWPPDAVHRAPEVAALCEKIASSYDTLGAAIAPDRIALLAEVVGDHVGFPGLVSPVAESGHEAFLRFRDADPLPFFDGWQMACVCRCEGEDHDVIHEGDRYERDAQATLTRLLGARPRIFLLWENSD